MVRSSLSARRARRLRAALALSVLAACAAPVQASANPAYGGTAPDSGKSQKGSGAAPSQKTPPTTAPGDRARLLSDGTAQAPASAPGVIKDVIAAGNQIAHMPYRYGGGHGNWTDTGYDCSGSVSFALHGAGLMAQSASSTGFYSFGTSGAGKWITIYANGGHMFMVVAGLRFDTSGATQTGSRWQTEMRSPAGYTVRHPSGL